MQRNQRGTRPEVAVRSAVHRRGLRFRKNRRPERSLRCEADIVFLRERVAVFIDGCFWHGCPLHGHRPQTNAHYWHAKIGRNVERDARNVEALQQNGWCVVRAWEHEDASNVADRIFQVVCDRRREVCR